MPTKRVYIKPGGDDGYWSLDYNGVTSFNTSGTSMSVGWISTGSGVTTIYGFFVRLLPEIPDDAAIEEVVATFNNLGTGSNTPGVISRLYAADNAAAPTSYTEAKNATLTSASTSQEIPVAAGAVEIDITDQVAEVHARDGFTEQSAIVIDVRSTTSTPTQTVSGPSIGRANFSTQESGTFAYIDITYNRAPDIVGTDMDYGPLGRVGSDAPGTFYFELLDEDEIAEDDLNWEIRTSPDGAGTVVASGTATSGLTVGVQITYTSTGIVPGANVLYLRVNDGSLTRETPFIVLVQQAGTQRSGLVKAESRGYELILRDMRSGKIVGWLSKFKSLDYLRSARGIGEWTLELSHTQIDGHLLSSGTALEVRREGWQEIIGPIVQPFDYDDANDRLTVVGRDMKYLLLARLTSLTTPDAVEEVSGETALRHYVGTWAVDQWNDWFGNYGAKMALQPIDQQRGGTVAHSALAKNVLDTCSTIALRSGLWFDIIFDEQLKTYRFEVYEITDAGRGTLSPWIFSTELENVVNMRYSRSETPTVMYGLGPIDEDTQVRTVETVTRTSIADAVASIPREAFVDLRYAGGSALPSQTLATLMEEAERAEQVMVAPNHRSVAAYRDGWDVGYRVGADVHRIGQYTEQLVSEVRVKIAGDGPEKFELTLGDPTVDLLDLLNMYFERTVAAQAG